MNLRRFSRTAVAAASLYCCLLTVPAIAQQPEDPEDDQRLGLWLDQTISAGLEQNRSLELEFNGSMKVPEPVYGEWPNLA